ncbi:rod shape-determining protein MreC [Aquifex pyrophilus]
MNLRSLNLYFFSLLLLTLFIILVQKFHSPVEPLLRKISYIIFTPFLKTEREIEEEVEKALLYIRDLKKAMKMIGSYKKLKEELQAYRERVSQYEEILTKLEEDLDFYFPPKAKYVVSKIIYYDPSGEDRFFIIRDGKNKEIKKGDIVVSKGYIIGIVDEVYPSTSKVITLFNEKTALLVSVENLPKAYIYRGGRPYGKLMYVEIKDNVKEGDRVLYKDLTMRIPPFPVGEVIYTGFGEDPFFKEVMVKPYVSPRSVEFVVVFKE